MNLGSSSSFQVEQPKDDNNFNNVDIERKIIKERKRNKTYKQRNKRKREITCKEKAYVHKERKRTYTQKEPCFLVYNEQVHKVFVPILHPTREALQNCSTTMQMRRNIGDQRRLINTQRIHEDELFFATYQ
jgi:hypothetical protein